MVFVVSNAPLASDSTVSASEDTPYTFTTDDFPYSSLTFPPGSSHLSLVVVASLPENGILYLDSGSGPTAVTAGQTVSRAEIEAGKLTFVGDLNEYGTGNAHFGFMVHVETEYPAGTTPGRVELADLDGDGHLDAVVADQTGAHVTVMLGTGFGAFNAAVTYATNGTVNDLALGDVDEDGNLDIVTVESGSQVSVLLGDGDGSFGTAQVVAGVPYAADVQLRDFDNDGHLDMAVAERDIATVRVLVGDGDGAFGSAGDYSVTPPGHLGTAVTLVSGDFNNDGAMDLLAVNENDAFGTGHVPPDYPGDVVLLLGNSDGAGHGDGTFQDAIHIDSGLYPYGAVVGDFDGDGNLDFAIGGIISHDITIHYGAGDGSFEAITAVSGLTNPLSLAAVDFDGDGDLDLTGVQTESSIGTVSVFLNNGDRTFGTQIDFTTGAYTAAVATGDLDEDGRPDIVTANYLANTVSLLLNTATSLSNLAGVTVDVAAVNDPVTVTAPATATVVEEASLSLTGLSISDVDAASEADGVYEVSLSAGHGTLSLVTTTGLTFTTGDGTADASLTFHGTLSDINAALATATYRGDTDYNGSDTVAILASDEFGGTVATGSGTATSDTGSIAITVTADNDAPVADPTVETNTTDEDTPVTGTLLEGTDVDGDTLTFAFSSESGGTVAIDPTTGDYTFTPTADFHGSASFTYVLSDGTTTSDGKTVTITVNAVNDAPVGDDSSGSGTEDGAAITGTVTASDVDGDGLSFSISQGAKDVDTNEDIAGLSMNGDGFYTFDAPDNYHGTVTFTFQATDGFVYSAPATVTLTVTAMNDAPLTNATTESATTQEDTAVTGTLLGGSDADGDDLTFQSTATSHGSVVIDATTGAYTFTPEANFSGDASFSYAVNDGTVNSFPKAVSVTVVAVQDAPVAQNSTRSGLEDGAVIAGQAGATDADGEALTYTLVQGARDAANHAVASLTFNADGSYSFDAPANFNGPVTFTFKANDGQVDSNVATVTLNVTPVNDAPTITSNGGGSTATVAVNENSTAVTTVKAADLDGDTLQYAIAGGADAAKFVVNSHTGALSFAEAPDFEHPGDKGGNNSYIVKVQAADGHGGTDVQTLTVNVANVKGVTIDGNGKDNQIDASHPLGGKTPGVEADTLNGKGGDDTIKAGGGADTIAGGKGADDLYAGADDDRDVFIYHSDDESGTAAKTFDRLFGFDPKNGKEAGADKIDLSDLHITFKDIELDTSGKNVKVLVDTHGGAKADMMIQVMDVGDLHKADFIL